MVLVTSTVATGASQPLQTVPAGGIDVPAGGYYDGLITTASNSAVTAATIIDGTASQDTTVTMTINRSGTGVSVGGISGPVLDLQGTGMDKYVIQLDYNEAVALASVGDERNLYVASSDGGFFENAVFANTDLPGEPNNPTEFFAAYDPSTDFHLGYYGVDTINNRVWAVLDHNSAFGLGSPGIPAPQSGPLPATEPASHVMAASGNLNAEVNPNGVATTVVFEFGSSPALTGASVVAGATLAGAGVTFDAVTSPVGGLSPQATYYYRADAITSSGTAYGGIQSFTTPPQPAVAVSASTPNAYVQGLTPGSFTISQNGTSNVTVQYSISGTATNGSLYQLFSGPVAIPAGSSSFTLDLIPLAQNGAIGDQTVTVSILPDENYTVSGGGATVTIHDTPENDWKLANFGAGANTLSIAGDLAVNNNAGITNLMAYGLGMNPSAAQTNALPTPAMATLSGAGYLTLNFTRNAAATDLTYIVEGSSDMVNWTPVCTYSGGAWSPPGNVLESGSAPLINVQAYDSIPETSGSARFLRLQISN
ncbi:MAG TPA: hypothetical protein VHY22_11945, partial [Chthoniobacteraceae bacterium]|jgi:hypothetical protein|nr:hypothetical protein [Chthoniobacteraceae bacterium]